MICLYFQIHALHYKIRVRLIHAAMMILKYDLLKCMYMYIDRDRMCACVSEF